MKNHDDNERVILSISLKKSQKRQIEKIADSEMMTMSLWAKRELMKAIINAGKQKNGVNLCR